MQIAFQHLDAASTLRALDYQSFESLCVLGQLTQPLEGLVGEHLSVQLQRQLPSDGPERSFALLRSYCGAVCTSRPLLNNASLAVTTFFTKQIKICAETLFVRRVCNPSTNLAASLRHFIYTLSNPASCSH